MREPEIVGEIDLAAMSMGQTISRYRQMTGDRESQLDQLRELRLQLEASLGMLENVLPG
jgi:CHASE3 domain sensor protein